MCTVTYIPTSEGIFITSNRDENSLRITLPPTIEKFGDFQIAFPKDVKSIGSWIAMKNNGEVAVLLNGAFKNHSKKPNYSKSRGFIPLHLLKSKYSIKAFEKLNLTEIENFTVIIYKENTLTECRWDGTDKYILEKDVLKPHIWSSATLYSEDTSKKRTQLFNKWIDTIEDIKQHDVINFHKNTGKDDEENGLIIQRDNNIKTVSITSITVTFTSVDMVYEDLTTKVISKLNFSRISKSQNNIALNKFRLSLKISSIKLFNWEYWPMHIVYAPMYLYWFYLSAKAKSFFFFSAANPLRQNAGFAMEKKSDTYQFLSQENYPKTVVCMKQTKEQALLKILLDKKLAFPLIVKPDMGERGSGVKLINDEIELVAYNKKSTSDFLIQEYITYKNEVGVFYHRIPGEEQGKITGIVGKEFLSVIGDGISTLESLISENDRHILQLKTLKQQFGEKLNFILPLGEKKLLVPYGNHCKGAKFVNLSEMISDDLTKVIDRICKQVPEFYFGRLDIKFSNWEKFKRGEEFAIIELNGAASEPTHMYDPKHSIFFAWKEIIKHWDILYIISTINSKTKSIPLMSTSDGLRMLNAHRKHVKLIS